MPWRIYYSDGSIVEGETQVDWDSAANTGVQIITMEKDPSFFQGFTHKVNGENVPIYGKQIWVGEDQYDPFGWSIKYGELIDYDQHMSIASSACGYTYPISE